MPMVIVAFGPLSGPGAWSIQGEFVKSYDPNAHDGRGAVLFTSDKAEALRFSDIPAAMKFIQQVPKARPTRADGLPNRPLTAFTLTIIPE